MTLSVSNLQGSVAIPILFLIGCHLIGLGLVIAFTGFNLLGLVVTCIVLFDIFSLISILRKWLPFIVLYCLIELHTSMAYIVLSLLSIIGNGIAIGEHYIKMNDLSTCITLICITMAVILVIVKFYGAIRSIVLFRVIVEEQFNSYTKRSNVSEMAPTFTDTSNEILDIDTQYTSMYVQNEQGETMLMLVSNSQYE